LTSSFQGCNWRALSFGKARVCSSLTELFFQFSTPYSICPEAERQEIFSERIKAGHNLDGDIYEPQRRLHQMIRSCLGKDAGKPKLSQRTIEDLVEILTEHEETMPGKFAKSWKRK